MNTSSNNHSDFDKRLDAMLRKTPLKASSDFTAKTLARLHSAPDVNDDLIDDLLARNSVTPSADFTARTVSAATHERNVISFMRPALAAAASVAICMTGIWTYNQSSYDQQMTAAASTADMTEIMTLAAALNDAAPLLEANATETLASLISVKE